MLQLAGPVVLAEIGWMTMGLVDTMMVGRVSAEAVGAVGVGGTLFFTVAMFGIGLLLGLDFKVAHAFGARRMDDGHRWLVQGVYLAMLTTLPGLVLVRSGLPWLLTAIGVRAEVLGDAVRYGAALSWSLLPLLVLTGVRRYLQAFNLVAPVTLAVLSANLVNAAANWVLIFGHLGVPAMGAEGAGWATCGSRVYMVCVLVGYLVLHDRRHRTGLSAVSLQPDFARIRRLVMLGLPAALQTSIECGVFAAVTALAGRLEPAALAAHQIALNAAAFTFMVPLGISSAGAVRVGHALGRRDAKAAERSGWTALLLGVHAGRRRRLRAVSGNHRPRVHAGECGHCHRHVVAAGGGPLSALRRGAGGGRRRAPRQRRHADTDALESDRALVSRAARGLPALLPPRLGHHRALGGPVHRSDGRRRGAAGGVVVPCSPTRRGAGAAACQCTPRTTGSRGKLLASIDGDRLTQ
jgi:putative MATE family efflux protein